ncbi:MAG: PQQ-dependent sugar dehydrogenase, partial [Pyrinomonadaceae bacterium]
MKKSGFWVGFIFCLITLAGHIFGQTPTLVPSPRLQPFLSGLSSPLYLTNAKDGSRRVFVVQQRGLIKVVQPGSTVATNFIDLSSKVSSSGSERGLLGLAFHPQFATNSFFFVNYTRQSDGATIIARYKAINNNSVGDPNSEVIVLTVAQPFSNHNGGMIEFRNDNGTDNLYIGMGDGGSGNDPNNNAQNINSLLGKYLRITPSLAEPAPTPAYTNPPDNPYVGINGADEIFAIGVRNPFRWSFDRANPSQLWAGDVGQNAIEEVDLITRGGNYGWRVYEGNSCTNNDPGLCTPTNYIPPVFQYSHSGGRCSITGGYVYRGGLNTFANGAYIYGDYCTGEIWLWTNNQQILISDWTNFNLSSFGEDEDGELYATGLSAGTVVKFVRPKANADFDGDAKTDISV